jgi:hypothetical protein
MMTGTDVMTGTSTTDMGGETSTPMMTGTSTTDSSGTQATATTTP